MVLLSLSCSIPSAASSCPLALPASTSLRIDPAPLILCNPLRSAVNGGGLPPVPRIPEAGARRRERQCESLAWNLSVTLSPQAHRSLELPLRVLWCGLLCQLIRSGASAASAVLFGRAEAAVVPDHRDPAHEGTFPLVFLHSASACPLLSQLHRAMLPALRISSRFP